MLSFDANNYDINSLKDLSVDAAAILKKREGRTIKAGGLWVYDNEIAQFRGVFEDGDIISVEDFDGYFMGYGFVNRKSRITVRLLSRRCDNPVTPAFLTQRVRSAWEYRKKVIDTSSCRLLFGEADFLPGLTVDKYEDILVVESLALPKTALRCAAFTSAATPKSASLRACPGRKGSLPLPSIPK